MTYITEKYFKECLHLYVLTHRNKTIYVGVTAHPNLRYNDLKCKYKKWYGIIPKMDILMTFKKNTIAWEVEKRTIESLRLMGVQLKNAEKYNHGRSNDDSGIHAEKLRNFLNQQFISFARSFGIKVASLLLFTLITSCTTSKPCTYKVTGFKNGKAELSRIDVPVKALNIGDTVYVGKGIKNN